MLYAFVVVGCAVSFYASDYRRGERIYRTEAAALKDLEVLGGTYTRQWRGSIWWQYSPYHDKVSVFQRVVSVKVGGTAWSMAGHFTDEQLLVLTKFKHLEEAHISSFALTENGLLGFAELQKLNKLQVDTLMIRPLIKEQLQEKLPNCNLVVNSIFADPVRRLPLR